ncbi:glycosyltransferase [Campylobacter concisus]|uniref:Glycosyltransferase n=1 Tax=Campylobacter concisus TaxID=199 RepID=A0A7S9RUJ5_9BACT|nr:glycosyltransferase [Campylobacter concisus]QPH98140.1 glycosyltransferase [Campylobacter concisus]
MFKKFFLYILIKIQFFVLALLYFIFSRFGCNVKDVHSFVIGVDEIANNIFFIGNILTNSTTVCLCRNKFYNSKYDHSLIKFRSSLFYWSCRIVYGPILLAYLATKNTHFFYIWDTGFTLDRNLEFKFLKRKHKKIICLFVGDDIRSIIRTVDQSKKLDIDTYANYYGFIDRNFFSIDYDNKKKMTANSADLYADIIFGSDIDQISYLHKKSEPWCYVYDKKNFYKDNSKFNTKIIRVLHVPSNAILKGTPLVRAAIKKLKAQGYSFEYIELVDEPNHIVLEKLRGSHIVLNSFYGYVPGLFGVEAMANNCAVLMSAELDIEFLKNKNTNDIWLMTKYWEIYDNLKYLLDNPEKIKYYANNGYDFAFNYYTYDYAKKYINDLLLSKEIL